MTLAKDNKVLWSDIQSIYSKLNNCQNKFSLTQTTAPSNPGVIKTNVVTDLKSHISSLTSSSFVNTSFVTNVNNISISTGDLLKTDPFNTMNTTLDEIYNINTCPDFNADFTCPYEPYSCFGSYDYNEYCNAYF